MKILLIVLICILFCLPEIKAQELIISGKVYAFKNLPLNNIKVLAKKSGNNTVTNSDGDFTIVCSSNEKLIFSGAGFKKEIKKAKNINGKKVKLIFKETAKNKVLALQHKHTSEQELNNSLHYYLAYNSQYSDNVFSYYLLHTKDRDKDLGTPQGYGFHEMLGLPFYTGGNTYQFSRKPKW